MNIKVLEWTVWIMFIGVVVFLGYTSIGLYKELTQCHDKGSIMVLNKDGYYCKEKVK